MAYYLSPGVFINEIDKSNYVAGVSSSISAIVLRNTLKGPEMKQVLITNERDLRYLLVFIYSPQIFRKFLLICNLGYIFISII
jgi:hypothetical protein